MNLLIAGYEEKTGPSLYFMDYLASIHELPRAAHGYAAHFTLGLLDRYYKTDLSETEGIKIIHMCIEELKTRFLVNRSGFVIKLVNKVCEHGYRLIDYPLGRSEDYSCPLVQGRCMVVFAPT